METDLEAHPANHDIYFGPDSMVIAKPRIFLLPRLYKNPFVTFVFALPGHIVRQVSQIPQLYVLFNFWDLVPQQHYVLDDPPSIPFFFFKLSSFFASFAFALGIWQIGRAHV